MFDSHNYRTRPDVTRCRFLPRNNRNMCLLSCYFLHWWKLYHVFDGEARGNDKARQWLFVSLSKALKCLPKAPENTPSSPWSCSRGKYMFVGSNSVFHHALIQLAPQIWTGHYSCSRTESQFDVCQALRN